MENLFEKRKKLICELTEDPRYVPMKEKELAIFMQVKPEDRRELTRALEELLAEGKLEQTRRGRYVKPEKKLCRAVGVYQSSENFGFVIPDNRKTVPDIFIAKENCRFTTRKHCFFYFSLALARINKPTTKRYTSA